MNPDLYRQAKDIFLAVCALPREERSAALAESCGDQAELRAEVQKLLDADEQSGEWETPLPDARELAQDAARCERTPVDEALPETIGAYKILRRIGEGGMGVVFEAEQATPRRHVAIKVLRRALTTRKLRRRFELEAEVLGQLQHDGIARIHEAGSDQDGAPFIAMEYVDGAPLMEYLHQQKPALDQRVQLLARICDAVDHAHRKGILHRDIKPSNVLVEPNGTAKVLDFGVARTIEPVPEATVQTESGQLIGTLPYMSPEQAGGQADAVDVRSDVYALGVLAYEAFCGSLPYPVLGKTLFAAVRVIREVEPRPLSAENRECRGDLETVVAKALSKDAERRYASAAEFAADLRRTLADEPIIARPPSAVYQFQKFARRNRALVVALIVAALALTTGAVGVVLALDKALEANETAESERKIAERQARIAAEVNAFLNEDLLGAGTNPFTGSQDADQYEALAIAEERLEGRFTEEPLIEAQIRYTLAKSYQRLSRHAEAEKQLRRAIPIFEEHAPGSAGVRDSWGALAQTYATTGKLDEAIAIFTDNEARAQEAGEPLPLSHRHNLAEIYRSKGDYTAAAEIHKQVVEAAIPRWGIESQVVQIARMNYAASLSDLHRLDEAEVILREVVRERTASFGPEHPYTQVSHNNLASCLMTQGRYADAVEFLEPAFVILQERLGAEHSNCIRAANNLIRCYVETRRFDDAETLARENLATAEAVCTEVDPRLATSLFNLALVFNQTERSAKALPLLERALVLRRATLGDRHRNTLAVQTAFGEAYEELQEFERAEVAFQTAWRGTRETLGPTHTRTRRTARRYATFLMQQKRYVDEVPIREEILAGRRAEHASASLQQRGEAALARAYRRAGRAAEALPLFLTLVEDARARARGLSEEEQAASSRYPALPELLLGLARTYSKLEDAENERLVRRELLQFDRNRFSPDNEQLWKALRSTANAEDAAGDDARATALLDEELELRSRHVGAADKGTLARARAIARTHSSHERFQAAHRVLEQYTQIALSEYGPNDPQTLRCLGDQVRLLNAQGRFAEAVDLGLDVHSRFAAKANSKKSTRTLARFLSTAYEGLGQTESAQIWLERSSPPPRPSAQPAN